jgi:putative ABC transport system permease protein
MAAFASDLKFALRAIRKQPGVSIVVAVTLAIGLGVNATVLGMMDAMLLRPFPFRDHERLVVLWEQPFGGMEREQVARANYLDWRRQARTVEQFTAWAWLDATLTGTGDPERVQGFRVSARFFDLLGIAPALGRTFTGDDEQSGNHRRVVLGDGLWKRRFGADPAIVGTDILVDGVAHTVVGVAPPRFAFPVGSELWVPLVFTPAQAADREERPLTVAGRLADGVSVSAAQSEMDAIAGGLAAQYPGTNRERGVIVRPLSTAFREGSTVPFVGILQAASALVMLVACANVAGLLLARALGRNRELAVRTALGASRGRIVRQIVTETVVLGLLASVVAIPLASIALDALRTSIPAETARFVEGWDNLGLDVRLVMAIPVLAIGVGLLVGLIPAIAATRTDLTDALKDGERGAAGGVRRQRGRRALVVAEIALALALLIGAGLTLAAGIRLTNDTGGFDPQALLTLQIPLPESKYSEDGIRREFATALLARFGALPGVERAALSNILPASGWSPASSFVVEHDPIEDAARRPRTGYRAISPGFFDTLRIPILSGRAFADIDREGGRPVAIVSASLAQRYFAGQDPLGKRLRLDGAQAGWLHIVGVAGDVRMFNWWDGEDSLAVYVPLRQAPVGGLAYAVLRTSGDPLALTTSIRRAVTSVDPFLPVSNIRTMRQAIADASSGLTHMAVLLAICGSIGAILSVVGIYSVMSYTVSQRMHEFGVRLALGASTRDLLRLMLREAGALTGLGLAIGFVLALVLGRVLASALFGLISLDPATFLMVVAGLAAVSIGAACLPARRALRLDPSAILRGQ